MDKFISYKAVASSATRKIKLTPDKDRDNFMRDRDRILYSKSFRRLSGKTQIFINGYGDNVRTRLTHTLEVSQIATTIAHKLGLNTMLTEAIALGHDLGHTPFGHAGERTLDHIMNGCIDVYRYNSNMNDEDKGFKHNWQSARVVCQLEEGREVGCGLNLCNYTLWGIVNHSSLEYKRCEYQDKNICTYKNAEAKCKLSKVEFYNNSLKKIGIDLAERKNWTLEGIIVGVADEIAQRHHDVEDGIYSKLIDTKDICGFLKEQGIIDNLEYDEIMELLKKEKVDEIVKKISKLMVEYYVSSYTKHVRRILNVPYKEVNITHKADKEDPKEYIKAKNNLYDYLKAKNDNKPITEILGFSNAFIEKDRKIKDYIKYRVHMSQLTQSMDGKASFIIRKLMKAYLTNPQQLPNKTIVAIVEGCNEKLDYDTNEIARIGVARSKLGQLIKENNNEFRRVLLRRTCDLIAGMTDSYAMEQFDKLYGTSVIIKN